MNAMMRRYLEEAGEWILKMVGEMPEGREMEDEDELAGREGVLENGNGNGNAQNGRVGLVFEGAAS